MNSEVEAFEGELKVLREFFDSKQEAVTFQDMEKEFKDNINLLNSYLKRKEIRENYEMLNREKD